VKNRAALRASGTNGSVEPLSLRYQIGVTRRMTARRVTPALEQSVPRPGERRRLADPPAAALLAGLNVWTACVALIRTLYFPRCSKSAKGGP
jgi:hypothetical protein